MDAVGTGKRGVCWSDGKGKGRAKAVLAWYTGCTGVGEWAKGTFYEIGASQWHDMSSNAPKDMVAAESVKRTHCKSNLAGEDA